MKTEQKDFLKKVTGMDSIPFVTAGIAADADGYVISEDGLTKLAEAGMANDTTSTKVTELETAATAAATKITALESQVQILGTEKANQATEITTLKAEVEKLGKMDGAAFTGAKGEKDKPEPGAATEVTMSQSQKELDEKIKNM